MTIPEGWALEPEDRSVGIFGDAIWHDDCPAYHLDSVVVPDDPQDPALQAIFVGWRGWRWNRCYVSVHLWTCRDCKQTVAFVSDEWDPDVPDDADWDGQYA